MPRKPKGFGKFDSLMRKLVKVPASEAGDKVVCRRCGHTYAEHDRSNKYTVEACANGDVAIERPARCRGRKEQMSQKHASGIELIAEERKRQIEKEGWTAEHDDEHTDGSLALAGAVYANIGALRGRQHRPLPIIDAMSQCENNWPWNDGSMKAEVDPVHNLVKAGALIAAEIDRLQRRAEKQ